jgi:hypothetical protein
MSNYFWQKKKKKEKKRKRNAITIPQIEGHDNDNALFQIDTEPEILESEVSYTVSNYVSKLV